jgi:hypothetical protein
MWRRKVMDFVRMSVEKWFDFFMIGVPKVKY